MLVVDDLHCADTATKEWLTWAPRRSGALLVIALARPGITVTGAHELDLGPLDSDAIGVLIGADGDPRRAAAVYARSEGNPLFALALADAPGHELPASVQDAVASTLAALDPAAADLVRAAAVFGPALDVDLLAGVLRVAAIVVIERLERAVLVGLLVERGPGFEFRHPLVREALGATVGAARSAFLHREAALVLDGRLEPRSAQRRGACPARWRHRDRRAGLPGCGLGVVRPLGSGDRGSPPEGVAARRRVPRVPPGPGSRA